MRAAVWHGAGDVRVEAIPDPQQPRPGQVLVEVLTACICGSDVAEYRDGPHVIPTSRPHPLSGRVAPLVLGHEYSGRVLAVGDGVEAVMSGDRVCGDACLRCGTCFWCLRGEYNICALGGSVGLHSDGAFAAFLEVPAYTLFKLPDGVSDRAAAIVEPLAVGLHALRRARFEAGESVVVVGHGMIGAAAAAIGSAIGAGQVLVVERSASRAKLALELGATAVLDPSKDDLKLEIRSRTEGRGADVVVDCTGNPEMLTQSVELARRGGRICVPGIAHRPAALATDRIVYFEREIIGSLGYRFDHPAVIQLLANQRLKVDGLFGETVPIDRIVTDGLDRLIRDPDAPLRIPVSPAG
jgi:(R,R)-butanediol dehydrogenase/meso-butanediol dehydrogenase/diacetyl reductase